MSPAGLVARLQARGVTLRPDGETLKVRPVSKVTPEELEALKKHKAAVLALLTRQLAYQLAYAITLDTTTIHEILGPVPDPHDLAIVRFDVAEGVARLEVGIRTGHLPPRRVVRGRPLADWLSLDDVARLLRARGTEA